MLLRVKLPTARNRPSEPRPPRAPLGGIPALHPYKARNSSFVIVFY